jgi:AcrR family transcriptional regulator
MISELNVWSVRPYARIVAQGKNSGLATVIQVRAADDRTARAIIRDEALRLFAERGPDRVRLRDIAAAAGVSPGLVLHHFGSLDGLRGAVDEHMLTTFESLLDEATGEGAQIYEPSAAGSIATILSRRLPPDSPIPGYLRRMILSDSAAGRAVFGRLYRISHAALDAMASAGMAAAGEDPDIRAAFLLVNDLALLLLRERIAEAVGIDPLSPEGLHRWTGEALAIYGHGLRDQR